MNDLNDKIRNILTKYFKYSGYKMYMIEKNKIISGKTIQNILINPDKKISEKTIQKIIKFPKINPEHKKELIQILNNSKKNKPKKISKTKIDINEELILKIFDNIIEKKILKKFNNSAQSYFDARKINSFNSAVSSRTLLGRKIWKYNDDMFEGYGEIKMLLDVTPKADKVQMKKGLLSVAENLRAIANEFEQSASAPKKSETDIIIDFEEE